MRLRLAYRRYSLPFRQPVRTAHGAWAQREGVIVRLTDEAGGTGYGEAAPIPWFGTETLDEIEAALADLGEWVTEEQLAGVPARLGCLRFALAGARATLAGGRESGGAEYLPVAALLPAGRAALTAAGPKIELGFRTFKWKVGVGDLADELALLDDVIAALPTGSKLRLDANGAWTARQAAQWLERAADRPIEFIEQPCFAEASQGAALHRRMEDTLRGLSEDYTTPLALDESLVGANDVERWLAAGWRGIQSDRTERIYPPPELMTYVEPAVPGTTYYADNPYPTVAPPHFLLSRTIGVLSGVRTDRSYLASDLKPVLTALADLAAADDGFDWRLRPVQLTAGDLSTFRLRLDLGYPRLGRVAPPDLRWSTDPADSRSRWGFVSGGTLTEDGSAVDNRKTALGGGTGSDQIRQTVDASQVARDEFAGGYPIYEGGVSSSTSDDRTKKAVQAKARGALLAGFASEVTVSGLKVRGDLAPTLAQYDLADDGTFRVGESTAGAPTTIIGQITGRTVEPAERGRVESVTLDVQGTQVPS